LDHSHRSDFEMILPPTPMVEPIPQPVPNSDASAELGSATIVLPQTKTRVILVGVGQVSSHILVQH